MTERQGGGRGVGTKRDECGGEGRVGVRWGGKTRKGEEERGLNAFIDVDGDVWC